MQVKNSKYVRYIELSTCRGSPKQLAPWPDIGFLEMPPSATQHFQLLRVWTNVRLGNDTEHAMDGIAFGYSNTHRHQV